MVTVSDAFKTAMSDGSPQRPLIEFVAPENDENEALSTVFRAEDISAEDGIQLNETLNADTDLTMGGCPESTLSFVLFNKGGTLREFEFGRCKAWLGVRIAHEKDTRSDIHVKIGDKTVSYAGEKILVDGVATEYAPSTTPAGLIYKEGILIFYNGDCETSLFAYADGVVSETAKTVTPNDFMKSKLASWAESGLSFSRADNITYEYSGGYADTWEYCSLGVFIAERPKVSRNTTLSIECKDLMSLFDVDLPEVLSVKKKWDSSNTPKKILDKICETCGVTTNAETFFNSTYVMKSRPSDFATATCRDVLGWIAEAACAYARFNRDGVLELAWFAEVDKTLTQHDYEEYEQYWYETAKIDKLVVRDSDYSTDTVKGEGQNGYIIENNPILGGG